MTREDIASKVLQIPNKSILLELATGTGKSKIALEILNSKLNNVSNPKILIVYPQINLKDNWIAEFNKWGFDKYLPYVTFTTYASLHKYVGIYDLVIYDECHHLSPLKRESARKITSKYTLLLSATIKKELLFTLREMYRDLYVFNLNVKSAIDNTILPKPLIVLVPLCLNDTNYTETFTKFAKGKNPPITIDYPNRFKYYTKRYKNTPIIVRCTQQQMYDELQNQVNYFNNISTMAYLQACNKRLKWLGEAKTNVINVILAQLQKVRTITFCNSISQCDAVGGCSIHSKVKNHLKTLEDFNSGKINHITAVEVLTEGVNLSSCQIGIWASLNSSERLITQKMGRILRHPKPYFIIPYFENTRDEEIVHKMIEGIDRKDIFKCSINNIKYII